MSARRTRAQLEAELVRAKRDVETWREAHRRAIVAWLAETIGRSIPVLS